VGVSRSVAGAPRRRSFVGALIASVFVVAGLGLGDSADAKTPTGVTANKEWQTGSLPRGVTKAKIDALVTPAMGARNNPNRVRSVLITIGDRIVYERYHPRDNKNTVMTAFSVSKSFTSTIVGLLANDGFLSLDARVPVASWADPADPRSTITLRNMLHMASGIQWDESLVPNNDLMKLTAAPSASEYGANKPADKAPNTEWEYNNGTSAILGSLVYPIAGSVPAAEAYMQQKLFGAIGIKTLKMGKDSTGRYLGYMGADMTTRDFARFGLLYLNRGMWGTKRVLPESWVDFVKTPSTVNPEYGGHFWLYKDGGFMARGAGGQQIVIAPAKKMVMVITLDFQLPDHAASMAKGQKLRDDIYALFPNQ
jgi:CubicO group peptidase (beta-lactamase class C family)